MSKVSEAYIVTEHIHDAFFARNGVLTPTELAVCGVRTRIGSTSSKTAQRVEIEGDIEGRLASQTLAKDSKGNFHLSTTFLECGGEHVQEDIRLDSPIEALETIVGTLFVRKLVEIVHEREMEAEGPTVAELTEALGESVPLESLADLEGMEIDEALGYAFTLLLENGIEDPEEFLKEKGILE